MPLLDHFHPPLAEFASWEELHGAWPGIIAFRLNSILPREYRSGLAEIVKYGVILDPDLFIYLENHIEEILRRDAVDGAPDESRKDRRRSKGRG